MVSPADDDTLGQRIVAALRDALQVRAGEVLTPQIIEERARNGACWVLDAIHDWEKENGPRKETAEEHAERVIK